MTADLPTAPSKLATEILRWNEERIGLVELSLRLAGVERPVLLEAYRILENELIRQRVAAEVDADAAARGRYCTDAELVELERESLAKPRRGFTAADKERLEELVRAVASEVCAEHPHASREQFEQLVFQRLRGMAHRADKSWVRIPRADIG